MEECIIVLMEYHYHGTSVLLPRALVAWYFSVTISNFSAKFVKEYIEAAKPMFSIGEYWDPYNYNGHDLDYNQDRHRQWIINWIDGTGQLSSAFDFTTKGVLQEAVKGQLWRLRDCQGKPPGVMGWWPSRAVTFLDNHDTGSTQAHWPFPANHIMEGYAYILTHPGIPTVFYDHFYDWGDSVHSEIVKLMDIRKRQDINSRSSVKILEARSDLYSAVIGEKLCMKIGVVLGALLVRNGLLQPLAADMQYGKNKVWRFYLLSPTFSGNLNTPCCQVCYRNDCSIQANYPSLCGALSAIYGGLTLEQSLLYLENSYSLFGLCRYLPQYLFVYGFVHAFIKLE